MRNDYIYIYTNRRRKCGNMVKKFPKRTNHESSSNSYCSCPSHRRRFGHCHGLPSMATSRWYFEVRTCLELGNGGNLQIPAARVLHKIRSLIFLATATLRSFSFLARINVLTEFDLTDRARGPSFTKHKMYITCGSAMGRTSHVMLFQFFHLTADCLANQCLICINHPIVDLSN